jgi:hypothetical protein
LQKRYFYSNMENMQTRKDAPSKPASASTRKDELARALKRNLLRRKMGNQSAGQSADGKRVQES